MAEVVNPDVHGYSMAELMAVVMSRALEKNDGKVGGVGAAATIPMAAIRLATLTVAPNIYWFCGSSGGFNPTFDYLPMTSADPKAFYGAEATQKMQDIVDMGGTGKWGFGFHGGMQIDKFGNANLIGIGPYDKLKVRGPGAVGLPWAGRMGNAYLFTWHHSKSIFVERVDHLCGPGWMEGGDSRFKALNSRINGPDLVFSPICVMDFHPESRAMRVVSVHPGYSLEDVVRHTGFELVIDAPVPQTQAPSAHELFMLRNFVDRGRVLKDFRLTLG